MNEKQGCGRYVTTKEVKKTFGVTPETLRRWADNGLISTIRTPGGQRLYNIQDYLHNSTQQVQATQGPTKEKICYCRVSSVGQKEDLQRQVIFMQEKFPEHKIITDIGSGINFKRKGLQTVLELASKGRVSEVVVAYRDRLCRFAFELVEWILHLHGVELLVLNRQMDSSGNNELAEDLLAIINVFNCRVNGRRKYKSAKKNEQIEEESKRTSESSEKDQAIASEGGVQ